MWYQASSVPRIDHCRSVHIRGLGDFRVAFRLCFKASPSANLNQNLRVDKTKLRTWTRFETEAKGNWEIAYIARDYHQEYP